MKITGRKSSKNLPLMQCSNVISHILKKNKGRWGKMFSLIAAFLCGALCGAVVGVVFMCLLAVAGKGRED